MNSNGSRLIDLAVMAGGVFVWIWFGQSDLLQSISDTGLRIFVGLCFSVALVILCLIMLERNVFQSLPNMIVRSIDGYFSRVSTSEDTSKDDNKEVRNMNKYVVVGLSVSSLLLLATSFFSFGLFIKTARMQQTMCMYSGLDYEVETEVASIVDALYISEKCNDMHIKCLRSKVRRKTHFSLLDSRASNCISDYKSYEDFSFEEAYGKLENREKENRLIGSYMNECGIEPVSLDEGKTISAGRCE